MSSPNNPLTLAQWRRTVAELYSEVRQCYQTDPQAAWQHWRAVRDDLFANHSQTPLSDSQQANFQGVDYFDYDGELAVFGRIKSTIQRDQFKVELSADGALAYTRIAEIEFTLKQTPLCLNLYWIDGYGGGLFLPFRDLTSGQGSFGGGRYLYDAIKGADLGANESDLLLDFNFSYNPSCAYNDAWVCPLSPPENNLNFQVLAGEKHFAF